MPTPSSRKLISRSTQPQYGLLRRLTDGQTLDAPALQTHSDAVVQDRKDLAAALLSAARHLEQHNEQMVKRSAPSRAYYAAYHMVRAVIFAVHSRDEDDHAKLPAVLDSLPDLAMKLGPVLKELRQLRNEMDYSPYPGPDEHTAYDAGEIDHQIAASIQKAEGVLQALNAYLAQRQ